MVKKQLASTTEFKSHRAGYTTSGTPANIHVLRSLRGALGRRIAIGGKHGKRLARAEEELENLLLLAEEDHPEVVKLRHEIAHLKMRINAIPFIDPFDLRYSNRVKTPKPSSQAVMFCVMDVSGSMDEQRKDTAKRFFILLYLRQDRGGVHPPSHGGHGSRRARVFQLARVGWNRCVVGPAPAAAYLA